MSRYLNLHEPLTPQLATYAEEPYRAFQKALLPGTDNLLGVRLPLLRRMAREVARDDWRTFLQTAQRDSFEAVMLRGMVIGCADMELPERLKWVRGFVPEIHNWSVCDSFCSGLKAVRAAPEQVWDFLQPYLADTREFYVRFGVVMLLTYYVKEPWLERVLARLDSVRQEDHYARMAVAWTLSVCYARFPQRTETYLRTGTLDADTYRKTLQKIRESRRVTPEAAARMASVLRR